MQTESVFQRVFIYLGKINYEQTHLEFCKNLRPFNIKFQNVPKCSSTQNQFTYHFPHTNHLPSWYVHDTHLGYETSIHTAKASLVRNQYNFGPNFVTTLKSTWDNLGDRSRFYWPWEWEIDKVVYETTRCLTRVKMCLGHRLTCINTGKWYIQEFPVQSRVACPVEGVRSWQWFP